MENFIAYNPTNLHFGRDVLNDLGSTVKPYGKKILLVYGGGSIKRNGIYQKVISQLKDIQATVFEYSGIKPNPVIEDVDAAAELGRKHQVDLVLAVGGGSVIDSAKIISITIPVQTSGWNFYNGTIKPKTAIPLISVLTLAATGTEMNPFAVVQNNSTKEKLGWGNDLLYPHHSFLDPQNTFSVPRDYTAYGIADLIAHCLEAYFGEGEATLSDRFLYAIIKEAIKYGPPLLDDPENYSLRANIMYAATAALNKLTMYGRVGGDWGVHSAGHVLSLLYDIPHGASLSIIYPAWLKLQKERIPERITTLGKNIFGDNNPDDTIKSFESFFHRIDCPISLSALGIGADKKGDIMEVMIHNNVSGSHHKLTREDYSRLIDLFI
ncbi:MAG: iron-containing alcohol dehydrogenase [Bacteroidales bacterium]|nr:iron-containing alcohol dehydrogenase [Bacteroidales bacterium]